LFSFIKSGKRIAHGDNDFVQLGDEMRKSYRGPSIDACNIFLYLDKWFQRRTFLEINQPETKIAYGGHVC